MQRHNIDEKMHAIYCSCLAAISRIAWLFTLNMDIVEAPDLRPFSTDDLHSRLSPHPFDWIYPAEFDK